MPAPTILVPAVPSPWISTLHACDLITLVFMNGYPARLPPTEHINRDFTNLP